MITNDQVLFMMTNANNWRDEFFSFKTNERITVQSGRLLYELINWTAYLTTRLTSCKAIKRQYRSIKY